MRKLSVFLADDHAVIREGLKVLINAESDMEVVGEADNGRSAWLEVKNLRPDVVVMDISMPELNGAKATERLRADCPETRVLALTVHSDQGYLQQMLKAGASGYVLKRAATHELIQAIRKVAAGDNYLDRTLAGKVVNSYVQKQSIQPGRVGCALSDREQDVLRRIALGYTNKEIGVQLNISVRTVETYKVRLMEKLDFHSRAEVVRYALLQGWLQDG